MFVISKTLFLLFLRSSKLMILEKNVKFVFVEPGIVCSFHFPFMNTRHRLLSHWSVLILWANGKQCYTVGHLDKKNLGEDRFVLWLW